MKIHQLPPNLGLASVRSWALMLFSTTAFVLSAGTAASNSNDSRSLTELNERYQRITATAFRQLDYQQVASAGPDFETVENPVEALADTVREAIKSKQNTQAIAYIVANTDIITDNIDADDVPSLVQVLLDNHAIVLAEHLLVLARKHAGNYNLARIRLAFAKHYASRAEWQRSLDTLADIDIANVLDTLEGDEAYISYGVALQGQKKHREAVKYYARVSPESVHYRVAQLNTALAYVRQDWWTDAQLAIANALQSNPSNMDALSNRLYTVMGFSQVQYGFYRDARESFRNVRIDSAYANRAMLGLGVAALHQEDMIGALNAFNHLKSKQADDISVLESYLLSAYALDKLGQTKTASATYTEAMAYYNNYLSRCDGMIDQIRTLKGSHGDHTELVEQAVEMLPSTRRAGLLTLVSKVNTLDDLLEYQIAQETREKLLGLRQESNDALVEQTIDALTEKKSVTQSYLSQSRFGLAQLYDAR